MAGLSIVVIAYNELESLKFTYNSWKLFCRAEDMEFIVVNNGSGDGTREWTAGETDILFQDYEETAGWGKRLNCAIEKFHIENDIFCVTPGLMFTPGVLEELQYAVRDKERTGFAGPLFANVKVQKQRAYQVQTCEEALAWKGDRNNNCEVMGLFYRAIYIKREAFQEIGAFEERLTSMESVMNDYMIRAVQKKWGKQIAAAALLFQFAADNKKYIQLLPDDTYMALEEKWGMHYFSFEGNDNIVRMIQQKKDDSFRVLEIGCDCGATLYEIGHKYKNAGLYGVELNPRAVEIASYFVDAEVGNIEEQNLHYEKESFDYIIFADVLEHLRDPEEVLKYCRQFLREGGRVLTSIPNLMHISVVKDLLAGNFTYKEKGLMDKTHIHWFTYNEILKTFERCGYQIETMQHTLRTLDEETEKLIARLLEIVPGAEKFMYEAFQYLVCAKKSSL